MTRRRLALGVLATAAVATGVWLAPRGLRRLAIFDVRRVELVGTRFLEPSHLIAVLGLPPGANIFDPTEPLARRLFAVRGVARITVHRRIPGTLVLEIQERPPVALARTDDRLVLVDREGRALPYDPAGIDVDLPIADADSAVLGVVERVRETDPELFAKVVAAVRAPHAVVLETPGHRLLLSLGATPREIEDLGLVLQEAARRGLVAAEFDARFAGRVIVRGGRS